MVLVRLRGSCRHSVGGTGDTVVYNRRWVLIDLYLTIFWCLVAGLAIGVVVILWGIIRGSFKRPQSDDAPHNE